MRTVKEGRGRKEQQSAEREEGGNKEAKRNLQRQEKERGREGDYRPGKHNETCGDRRINRAMRCQEEPDRSHVLRRSDQSKEGTLDCDQVSE
ncbi:hypothetical protein CBR_g32430 [Chara braunii]|uniref:Uncharacterized protein n=1 Tax=Chara braunii TaxID=69332 RepID=A0A388JYK3_CHABU|nr:hypothetical protein CBR_g32430 [Chara braunii]|eukprot:GBG62847.1 hypothetical protein CBR_g32430 [Chara braunii]